MTLGIALRRVSCSQRRSVKLIVAPAPRSLEQVLPVEDDGVQVLQVEDDDVQAALRPGPGYSYWDSLPPWEQGPWWQP